MTLDEVNALDQEQFVAALGGLFEGPPWIVASAWQRRPFASSRDLLNALCAVMYSAPLEQRIALIQAHPDLAGRAALAGTLGAASAGEQAAAGLGSLSPDELARFTELNGAYRNKFGFPFVICARLRSKDEILQAFGERLGNSPDREVQTALDEIAKICSLRLDDLLAAT
jgi:OHCU decarboxylase